MDIGAFEFQRMMAVGAAAGAGPHVQVYNPDGTTRASFFAFDPRFVGGVRVAVADVNGDGMPDIIVAAGPSGGPHVKVIDGTKLNQVQANGEIADSALLASFYAYNPAFTGGVYVAAGDLNGDGKADIITGAGAGGGPHVKAFSGADGSLLLSFFAYDPSFAGGVRVAAGDVLGNGQADIITGAGPGGGPHVKAFDGKSGGVLESFFAFDPAFTGGVFVAAGDVNGAGHADFIATGGSQVKVFDGTNPANVLLNFSASGSISGGVTVAAADVNGDGNADIITGAGFGGSPRVKVFDGTNTSNVLQNFLAFDPGFLGGVFVG